jgi:glycosyltransferase involved in cell wall biosynthesis
LHANEIVDLQPAYAARLTRRPLVWAIRAGFSTTPGLTKAFSRIAVRNSAKIIPVSNSVRTSFFGWYDNADQKIEVLYDAPRFTERVDPGKAQSWRDRLGLGAETKLIVLVSKLMPQKGHRVLLDAAPTIFARFPDTRILIVGGEADGKEAYAAGLRSLALADSRIQLFGQADDVPGMMAASDVVVHCPVFRDPLPGVVIEGMVAARPVVGARIGGIPEIIVDGVTGRLSEANNPADLAEKVISILDLSPEDRNAMGERGRERALTVFSRDNYLQGLRRIYEAVGPSS